MNTFFYLLFLKIRPNDAIVENLFQCVHLAAHSRFYFICKNESSWVNACNMDNERIADAWAIEFLG